MNRSARRRIWRYRFLAGVWNCHILNQVVESQLFTSLWNRFHQWLSGNEIVTQLADTGKQASSNLLSVVEIAQRKKSVSTSLRRATDVNATKTTVGDCSRDITIPMNIASEEQTHGIFGTIRRLTWQLLARVSSTAPDTSGHCEGREEGSRPIRATKSPPFDSYQEYIMPKECT